MQAEALLKAVADPNAWLDKSLALRRAGDSVWAGFFQSLVRAFLAEKGGESEAIRAAWAEADGYLQSSCLLYGLALETAFKAHILRHAPHEVSLQLVTDGASKVVSVEIKQLGVPIKDGHSLEALAHKAGAFNRGPDAIFQADSDYQAMKEILAHLSEAVLWRARYPTPLKSGPARESDPNVPGKVLGHYLRDWLDPLLDHFQRAPNNK
ncbi:MAG: hypothetical protein IPK12_08420 [Gemmatimonadetes bacterium]|nr:hypothetical protein [Gemmatimonadota bacterium]